MKKTILIVDDSDFLRQHLSSTLRRAGFGVAEAADGRQGLAMIDARRGIDMVICDVNMPNMDGIEMVAEVKSRPENNSLPILMLSTEGQIALVKRAKEAGAVGWIVKPFDAGQLIRTVSHLTGLGT